MLKYLAAAGALLLALMVSGSLVAQPPGKGKDKGGPPIEFSAAQQEQLEALVDKSIAKVAEFQRREADIVTPEQRAAAEAARITARAAGMRGAAEKALTEKLVRLTDKQRQELEQLEQDRRALEAQINQDVFKILTPEQRGQLARNSGEGKAPGFLKLPPELQLNELERAKLQELVREFEIKRRELDRRAEAVLTDRQLRERDLARERAKSEGKKGKKEEQAAVTAALELTPEQVTQIEALDKERAALEEELRARVLDLIELK